MSNSLNAQRFFVLIAVLVLAIGCGGVSTEPEPTTAQDVAPALPAMDTLVSTEWLSEHLDDPDLVVLDCTVMVQQNEDGTFDIVNGRANYESGHIPSAGFADLLGDLADGDSELQFALPTSDQFAQAMSALGVGDESRVVLYDAMGSAWAARVWWMLRWIGFDRAALLDGGLGAWTAEDRPLSTETVQRPVGTLTVAVRPRLIADRDEVLSAIDDGSVHIVDVLPPPHYRGEMAMYARPGHIRSAVNIPVMQLTDESGRYLPLDELAAMYTSDHDARHITYCGGGIAASSSAYVMTRLGYSDVAVYTASLQEWAADPTLPMETAPTD